jgi:hypothetical protein
MGDLRYWASEGLDLAREAYSRVRRYYNDLPTTVMFKRWSKAYRNYYGLAGEEDPFDISRAMQTGDKGQLTSIKLNHIGSLGRRAVALVSQTVPDWDIIPSSPTPNLKSKPPSAGSCSTTTWTRRASELACSTRPKAR